MSLPPLKGAACVKNASAPPTAMKNPDQVARWPGFCEAISLGGDHLTSKFKPAPQWEVKSQNHLGVRGGAYLLNFSERS